MLQALSKEDSVPIERAAGLYLYLVSCNMCLENVFIYLSGQNLHGVSFGYHSGHPSLLDVFLSLYSRDLKSL